MFRTKLGRQIVEAVSLTDENNRKVFLKFVDGNFSSYNDIKKSNCVILPIEEQKALHEYYRIVKQN